MAPITFRFNPDAWDAWPEAIDRHQRQGEGESLALMLRRGGAVPAQARSYLAGVIERSAKRPRGRPVKGDADAPAGVWAAAVHRHAKRGDGGPLALLVRSGEAIPPAAREHLAGVAAGTAKRAPGRVKLLDPAKVYRDRRVQMALMQRTTRVAVRGSLQRELLPGEKARADERVLVLPIGQTAAVEAVAAAIEGTPDELRRTEVARLAQRLAPGLRRFDAEEDPSEKSGDLTG